jgi:hypothetical protein
MKPLERNAERIPHFVSAMAAAAALPGPATEGVTFQRFSAVSPDSLLLPDLHPIRRRFDL